MTKLEEKQARRNFALGIIDLAFDLDDPEKAGIGAPLEQCIRYFKRNATTNACFGDIQSHVALLSADDQQHFLKEIKAFNHDDKVFDFLIRELNVDRLSIYSNPHKCFEIRLYVAQVGYQARPYGVLGFIYQWTKDI